MPPLQIMIKPVSGSCNLRCKYCFYIDEMSHRSNALYGKMSFATAETLIRKAFICADDSIFFSFQGGEPLLAGLEYYSFFVKTVEKYNVRKLQINYSIQTNGTILSDDFCSFFAKEGFLVGVSLDGVESVHNAYRVDSNNNGSYSLVMDGIRMLQKHGVDFNILCVITKETAKNIYDVIKSLRKYENIQFIPCIDSFDENDIGHSLDADEYGRVLVEIFQNYSASFFSKDRFSERRMDNYISMLLGYPPEHCGMSGCCGVYYLIEADGSVFPCDFYVLDQWCLGNINDTSFLRMEKSERALNFHRQSREVPHECSSCDYYFICRGGCRRDREPDMVHNRFCASYKYFFDKCIDDMKILAEKIGKDL